MNSIPVDRADRMPRVPFRQPVRVVPLGGPPRAFRILAGNLSKGGMFLNTDQPFDEGTKVALSLEAGGRVLPFAQGEVVWRRMGEHKPGPGFGVKFTGFLHPRAHDMVTYLVKAIESGEPLTVDGSKPHTWKQVAMAGAAALLAGALVTGGFLAVFGSSTEAEDEAPAPVVTAPVVEAAATSAPAPVEAQPATPAAEAAHQLAAPPAIEAPQPIKEVKTIALAPMELNVAEPKPVAPAAAPVEGKGIVLPSGAATKLGWTRTGETLTLTLTLTPKGRIDRAFLLQNPPRVAIDVVGGAPKKSHTLAGPDASLFHRVRVGRAGSNTTRLVVDLARAGKKVETSGARVIVSP